jgi:hypothetical protein
MRWRLSANGVDEANNASSDLVDVCAVDDIPETGPVVRRLGSERVVVFKYGNCAFSDLQVCQHQNGPLAKERSSTATWFAHRTDTSTCPTAVRHRHHSRRRLQRSRSRFVGHVLVDPRPLAPGTRIDPARIA